MIFNQHAAREILDISHNAWSRGDVEGVLAQYCDDLTYWTNTGPDGGSLIVRGKVGLRAMLQQILLVAESMSASESFHFSHGIGRAQIEAFIRHRQTGLVLSGSYRQIVTFRGDKIVRLDEYHDAAKMAAFWRLVTIEVGRPQAPSVQISEA